VHEDGHFGGRVAATYDETKANLLDPATVEPTVDLQVEYAGGGRPRARDWNRLDKERPRWILRITIYR
jgi:hypothetical protein